MSPWSAERCPGVAGDGMLVDGWGYPFFPPLDPSLPAPSQPELEMLSPHFSLNPGGGCSSEEEGPARPTCRQQALASPVLLYLHPHHPEPPFIPATATFLYDFGRLQKVRFCLQHTVTPPWRCQLSAPRPTRTDRGKQLGRSNARKSFLFFF